MTQVEYKRKISTLVGKMFSLLPRVRAENKAEITSYLLEMNEYIMTIVDAVNDAADDPMLRSRFQNYVESEEERLRSNLEAIKYDIDATETVPLITGPGRIEKVRITVILCFLLTSLAQYILPLLYLIIKRHFEIFRVAQKRILHPDEVWVRIRRFICF